MASAVDDSLVVSPATNSSSEETADSSTGQPASPPTMQFPLYMRIIATIACVVIFTIGVCGNLLVPLVVIKTKYLRNSTNLFLINLSVADLLVLIVCMPTVLIELHSKPETWLLGKTMCKMSNYVEILAANGSIFTILAISFERYYAICKPLKAGYKCTRLRATLIICLVWFLSSVVSSPIAYMAKSYQTTYIDNSLVYNCIIETSTYWHKAYVYVSMFVFFWFPLLVLMVVYWLIGRRLVRENISSKSTTTSLATSDSTENSLHTSGVSANLASNFRRISFKRVPSLAKRPLATFFIPKPTATGADAAGRQQSTQQQASSQLSQPIWQQSQEALGQQLAPTGRPVSPKLRAANPCGCHNSRQPARSPECCCDQMAATSVSAGQAKPGRQAVLQKALSLDHHELFSGQTEARRPGTLAPCGNQLTGVCERLRTASPPSRAQAQGGSSRGCKGSDCQLENNDSPSKTSVANQFVYQLLHIKLNTTQRKNKDTKRRRKHNKANYVSGFGDTTSRNNFSGSNGRHGNCTLDCCSANSTSSSLPPTAFKVATTPELARTSQQLVAGSSSSSSSRALEPVGEHSNGFPLHSTTNTPTASCATSKKTPTATIRTNSCFTTGSEQSCAEDQGSQVPFLPADSCINSSSRAASANRHEAEAKCNILDKKRAHKASLKNSSAANRKSRAKFTWRRCTFGGSSSSSSSSSSSPSSVSPSSSSSSSSSSSVSASALSEAGGERDTPATSAQPTSTELTQRSSDQGQLQPRPIIHCNGSNRRDNWRQRCPSEGKKFARFNMTLDDTSTAGQSPMSPSAPSTPPLVSPMSPPLLPPTQLLLSPKPITPASEISSISPFGSSKSPSPESIIFENERFKFAQKISDSSGAGSENSTRKGNGYSFKAALVEVPAESKKGCQRLSQVNEVDADLTENKAQTTTTVKANDEFDGNSGQRKSSPSAAGQSGSAVATITSTTGCDNKAQTADQQCGHLQLETGGEEFWPTADTNNSVNNNNRNTNSLIGRSSSNNNDASNNKSEKFKIVSPIRKRKSLDKQASSDHNHQHHHFHFSLRRSCKRRSGSQPIVCSHFSQQQQQKQQQSGNGQQLSELLVVQDLSKKQQMESRRQVVLMLAFVVACFFLLFFPYRVFTIWVMLSSDSQLKSLGMETYYNLTYFSRILIYLHSAINPIAYNLISTKFRRAFTSILLCRGSSSRRQFTTEHRIINNKVINHDQRRSLRSSTFTSP